MALPARRGNELTTWNPFRELDDLHSRFSQLLESTIGDVPGAALTTWAPPVDIEETDEGFLVEAELPGVKRDDVSVELGGNELHIHGEIKQRQRTGVLRRQTRRTGQFDYRVTLPGQVDADSVNASLKDGVLRLELRKSEQDRPRRIQITAS